MTSASTIAGYVVIAVALAASAEAQETVPTTPAAEAVQRALITFVEQPRWQRRDYHLNGQLIGDTRFTAAILVTGDDRRPLPGVEIVLFARSHAGVFRSVRAVTDDRGRASPEIFFGVAPGSLRLTAQACLAIDTGLCTGLVSVSLPNRVDADLSADVGYVVVELPAAGRSGQIQTDNVLSTIVSPRIEVTFWQTEANWRYYSVSGYGTIPFVMQQRAVGIPFASAVASDTVFDFGDVAAGVMFRMTRLAILDISYNGRNGRTNLVESLVGAGDPRAVSLGDGFESVDTTLHLTTAVGEQRHSMFLTLSGSHALDRVSVTKGSAHRGDGYQATGGFGFVRGSRGSAVVVWGGYGQYGALEFRSPAVAAAPSVTITGQRREGILGVSRIALGRGPVAFGAGVTVGGFGGPRRYVGLNTRVTFRIM
jgi:hypothetical protein